ncbi:MAG TPA: glutathione S-transferase family protein [Candidatus Binatia bacterium]|nr:glutathione S-transferase family protein [Candidatus Binatia bacterium]
MNAPLTLIGHDGSPYSRKMRALLRYRRIAHRWVVNRGPEYVAPPKVPVEVIPVLVWHDDQDKMIEAMVDSTPQIRRLENEHAGRSVLPPDPALEFLDALLEDYADEWCTKLMFHYRWADAAGVAWAGHHIVQLMDPAAGETQLQQTANFFTRRQTERLWAVGSNATTAPVIEEGYVRLLGLFDGLIGTRMFLFGGRPAAADFALYGQLAQLCLFDPTSMRIARERAPRVVSWTERLDDLSGWRTDEAQWLARDAALPALLPLLREIDETYLPFLLANAAARAAGSDTVSCTIRGVEWKQNVFAYQAKCLRWLHEHFATLSAADQAWARATLASAGCAALVDGVA